MKVLISKGFGAGWSTWNSGEVAKYMRTYQPIIDAIESGKEITESCSLVKQMVKECKKKFGDCYVCILGADGLCVEEATPPFQIHEYDGAESIVHPGDSDSWVMS